jgi:voltage-gated potassium channel
MIAALVVYFVVPVRSGHSAGVLALEIAISLAGVALVGWIVLGELLREWRGGSPTILRGRHLLLLFEVVLLGFALTYYVLSVYSDGEMAGLRTRVDALYFTATTMTTVGYGDIHPIGQVARVIATVHMGFNVLFVAAVVRLLDVRVRRASGASPDAADPQPGR